LVHVGGSVDVGASVKDGLDDIFVPAFDRDVQRREPSVQASFAFWVLAQNFRHLFDVAGLDCLPELLCVDHITEKYHVAGPERRFDQLQAGFCEAARNWQHSQTGWLAQWACPARGLKAPGWKDEGPG
jgi:hypothetical protein